MRQRGFTLVEVMVVVIILGIVAGSAYTTMGKHTQRKKFEVCESELDSIEAAMQAMISIHGVTSIATASATLKNISGAGTLQGFLSKPIGNIVDPWGNEYRVYVQRSTGTIKIYLYSYSTGTPHGSFDGVSNIRGNPYKSNRTMLRVIVNYS